MTRARVRGRRQKASKAGELVERLDCKRAKGDISGEDENVGRGVEVNLWTRLPDEVFMFILARLPVSSFYSFRAVCRRWQAVAAHPDAALMRTREVFEVPVCVMYLGSNQFACYNPSSDSWHRMPGGFGSSSGIPGFQSEETRVVAGAGGLLVLETPHMRLWVINPINRSGRELPPLSTEGVESSSVFHVHLHLDLDREGERGGDSYKVFVTCKVRRIARNCLMADFDFQIYDSRTDSWERSNQWFSEHSGRITSTVVLNGKLHCMAYFENNDDYRIFVLQDVAEVLGGSAGRQTGMWWFSHGIDGLPGIYLSREHLDMVLRSARMDVIDGELVVVGCISSREDPTKRRRLSFWKIKSYEWEEYMSMPLASMGMGKLSLHPQISLSLFEDFIWVTDFFPSPEVNPRNVVCGFMCHKPSRKLWKLPKLLGKSPLRVETQVYAEKCKNYSQSDGPASCPPFLFQPRMDLIP